MALGFAAFGLFSWRMVATGQGFVLDSSVVTLPPASAALILSIVLISLLLGLSMSSVNIVSQTTLQDSTPERLRGRVFAVQFMLNNLIGIPPMLAIAGLADLIGIAAVLLGVSLVVAGVLVVTIVMQRRIGQDAAPGLAAVNATAGEIVAAPPPAVKAEAEAASEPARTKLETLPAVESSG